MYCITFTSQHSHVLSSSFTHDLVNFVLSSFFTRDSVNFETDFELLHK